MGLNKSCLFNVARYSILDMEYGVQISGIGGWGAELNREIVSCRACVRAVCMSSEFGVKIYGPPLSLFPFRLRRFSLFPLLYQTGWLGGDITSVIRCYKVAYKGL